MDTEVVSRIGADGLIVDSCSWGYVKTGKPGCKGSIRSALNRKAGWIGVRPGPGQSRPIVRSNLSNRNA